GSSVVLDGCVACASGVMAGRLLVAGDRSPAIRPSTAKSNAKLRRNRREAKEAEAGVADQDFIDRIIEGFQTLRERPHLDVVAAQFAAGEIAFVVDYRGIRT